ncbi:atrial natriuretic peptide receptor 3-like [Littorina saxatilis]|uniref:atrial natriuretic peptide receptor 3-like n=1 Tax=Littorina saxatilis TaxID=31220 RepID=UPI0038B4FFC1
MQAMQNIVICKANPDMEGSVETSKMLVWLKAWVMILCVLSNLSLSVTASDPLNMTSMTTTSQQHKLAANPPASLQRTPITDPATQRKKRHKHTTSSELISTHSDLFRQKRDMTSESSATIAHCMADVKGTDQRHDGVTIYAAVFVPFARRYMFNREAVIPAVRRAVEEVGRLNVLPGYRFHLLPGDSKCNSRDAAMHAFHAVTRYKIRLFLGPVCDYSLAPVARYAPYWNIPIVAPGGFAHNFINKNEGIEGAEYPLLTRIGSTFNSMCLTILDMLTYFRWDKVKVIYDSTAHHNVVPSFCHLAGGAMGYYLEKEGRAFDIYRTPDNVDIEGMLEEELDTEFAGTQVISNDDRGRLKYDD